MRLFSLATALLLLAGSAQSWSPQPSSSNFHRLVDGQQHLSRRDVLAQQGAAAAALCSATASLLFFGGTIHPPPALAAAPPTPQELERLAEGHARVRYLLDHWDEVTRVCGTSVMSDRERKQVIRTEGGGGTDACVKTPLRVQEFLGFKSTQDPLFRVEKLMVRATPLVDPDDLDGYLEAVERYKEKADSTAMMAYTSSWGEANPNGSKEVIEDYLERTKLDVIESEKSLREVMKYLNLSTLPPIQEKL